MKTAIYIEDGLMQFVLTPETDIDKKILVALQSTDLKTYRGNFYACRGGWMRQDPNHWDGSLVWRNQYLNSEDHNDESLIFVINNAGQVAKQIETKPEGVDISHPETAPNMIPPYSTVNGVKVSTDGCKFHTAPEPCADCQMAMFGQCDRHSNRGV